MQKSVVTNTATVDADQVVKLFNNATKYYCKSE